MFLWLVAPPRYPVLTGLVPHHSWFLLLRVDSLSLTKQLPLGRRFLLQWFILSRKSSRHRRESNEIVVDFSVSRDVGMGLLSQLTLSPLKLDQGTDQMFIRSSSSFANFTIRGNFFGLVLLGGKGSHVWDKEVSEIHLIRGVRVIVHYNKFRPW